MFFSFHLSLILMSGIRKLGLLSPKIWYNSWVFNEDQISRYSALQGFNPLCFAYIWGFCRLSNFLWDLLEAKNLPSFHCLLDINKRKKMTDKKVLKLDLWWAQANIPWPKCKIICSGKKFEALLGFGDHLKLETALEFCCFVSFLIFF
jgi:hypothetical protein